MKEEAKDTILTMNEVEDVRKTHRFLTSFPYGVLRKYLIAQAEKTWKTRESEIEETHHKQFPTKRMTKSPPSPEPYEPA